jgi:hypothetical protein
MKKILTNKNGAGYILTCIMVIIGVVVLLVLLQYMSVYHTAKVRKDEIKLTLDGYVTRYAIESYDALKQGEQYSAYLDVDGLKEGAQAEIAEYIDQYNLSDIRITPLYTGCFGIQVEYVITIPFEMFGRKISDIHITVTTVSQYAEK